MTDQAKIEAIVKQVLAGIKGDCKCSAPAAANGAIPKTSRVAMLTAKEHFEIQEYPIPEIGDDDVLVKNGGMRRMRNRCA